MTAPAPTAQSVADLNDDQGNLSRKLPSPRPGDGPMDDTEFQAAMQALLHNAASFIDNELSLDRAKATDYYFGRPLGNEEEGRSQYVATEVRDAVLGTLPGMMRVVFGPKDPVAFEPTRPDQVQQAKQITKYLKKIFLERNDGFSISQDVLKDGLIRKLGWLKWGWDDSEIEKAYTLRNLTQEQVELLAGTEGVKVTAVRPSEDDDDAPEQAPPQQAQGAPGAPQAPPEKQPTFTVDLTRKEKDGRIRIWSLPPEEVIYTREARSVSECALIAHRCEKTRGELVAMGVSEADLDEHGAESTQFQNNIESLARNPSINMKETPNPEPASRKILYCEAYPYIDFNGDGKQELRRVCTIGPSYYPVFNEAWDERPFAGFCPDPEPHTLLGQSWADRTMDLQRIKSSLFRALLDSLAASIFPRTGYVEGQVNVQDILNTAIGAPIRMKQPGMVQELNKEFVGKEALPVLAYTDDIEERRTGQSKGAGGLDADALQSSTPDAVAKQIDASEAIQELLARNFCEQVLKPMFRGLLRLMIKHQPRAEVIQLEGQFVEMDPRLWDAEMNVTVQVALGSSVSRMVVVLTSVLQKQEQYMLQLGPQNPMVGLNEIRNTIDDLLSLENIPDVSRYFRVIPPGYQMPAPQPQQDPAQIQAQMMAQVEHEKNMRMLAIKEAELQMKQQQMWLQDDRERQRMSIDQEVRLQVAAMQFHANVNETAVDADIERNRSMMDHTAAVHQAQLEHLAAKHEANVNAAATVDAAAASAPEGSTE